jgi:hypothetical protein
MISFLCSRIHFHEGFNQRSFKRMTEEKDNQKEEKLLVMDGRKGREAVGHGC